MLKEEQRSPYIYPEPRVNPSELSAWPADNRRNKVVGACQRKTIFKLFGVPVTEPMRAHSARIFRVGRFFEDEMALFLKKAGLFVASGVRKYVPGLVMSFELDLVARNPATNQAIIIENKTIKGEWMAREVMEGHPKPENLMQLCVYLDYIRTGKRLKELIAEGQQDREVAVEFGDRSMNRIEVNEEALAQIEDGPIVGLLLYEDRETCGAYELEVSLGSHQGLTYPAVNGVPFTEFSMESVYQRRMEVQQYWHGIVQEAKQVLANMGVVEPQAPDSPFGHNYRDPGYLDAKKRYWDQIGAYFNTLPPARWPEADYEFKYSREKLAYLRDQKLLRRGEITAMNKGERVGDFNCGFCDYRTKCVAVQCPELRHMAITDDNLGNVA